MQNDRICTSQYASVPWRPMLTPVDMVTDAPSAAIQSRAMVRTVSASMPVTGATRSAG